MRSQTLLALTVAIGASAFCLAQTDAVAAPIVKKIPAAELKVGRAKAVNLPATKPGESVSRVVVAGALEVAETELGRQTTLSIDKLKDGKSYMKLLAPLSVDPSKPEATFALDRMELSSGATVYQGTSLLELHFLAKKGKRYFIECDVTRDGSGGSWGLGIHTSAPMPHKIATSSQARPAFVYTADADGDTRLDVLYDRGPASNWSARSCSITPQK